MVVTKMWILGSEFWWAKKVMGKYKKWIWGFFMSLNPDLTLILPQKNYLSQEKLDEFACLQLYILDCHTP